MATGFGGWGMANGMMSALLISDQIILGHSKWEELFDPSRKTFLQSATDIVKENWNVAERFHDVCFHTVSKTYIIMCCAMERHTSVSIMRHS